MNYELTDLDKQILAILDTRGGYLTGDVAAKLAPTFGNTRPRSSVVRSYLLRLEKEGFVKRLDQETPTCWLRVATDESS